jgi:hypothetical protein
MKLNAMVRDVFGKQKVLKLEVDQNAGNVTEEV